MFVDMPMKLGCRFGFNVLILFRLDEGSAEFREAAHYAAFGFYVLHCWCRFVRLLDVLS